MFLHAHLTQLNLTRKKKRRGWRTKGERVRNELTDRETKAARARWSSQGKSLVHQRNLFLPVQRFSKVVTFRGLIHSVI